MYIENLKVNLKKIIELKDEIQELKKEHSRSDSLKSFVEQFRERLIFTEHGERDRFFTPKHIACTKLDEFAFMTENEINAKFSTYKTKLLSIVNRYIKDLQRGFVEHDLESNSIHRNQ